MTRTSYWLIATVFALSTLSDVRADDHVPYGIVLQHNIRYRDGASKNWMLDLAKSAAPSVRPRPAIVVIHGGGWIEGDKSSFSTPSRPIPGNIIDFAKLGFVAVTINYRLAREAPFPAGLVDCQCAVRWLRAHAKEHNINPERIGAYGNSAGGHLALMLALADGKAGIVPEGPWQEHSSAVQAAASDSGPLDLEFQYHDKVLRGAVELFLAGPPDAAHLADYRRASPVNYTSTTSVPLLMIYGVADSQVPVSTADRFVEALGKAGLKDLSYHRLAAVDHCPHSIQRVKWLAPVVNEFFVRTLKLNDTAE